MWEVIRLEITKFNEVLFQSIDEAALLELGSDEGILQEKLYGELFDFFNKDEFSGDCIFTWKSPAHIKDGVYYNSRQYDVVENNHFIGNLFPNFVTDKKHSLNTNRNGCWGDFPSDHFDIFLAHVSKYAFHKEVPFEVKEYYPLKRAIEDPRNLNFFQSFGTFPNYLAQNFFDEIWDYICKVKPFSDMEFEEYRKESQKLIVNRGKQMLQKLL